jgi:hypothetical protein
MHILLIAAESRYKFASATRNLASGARPGKRMPPGPFGALQFSDPWIMSRPDRPASAVLFFKEFVRAALIVPGRPEACG